jgi:hypothetical protein
MKVVIAAIKNFALKDILHGFSDPDYLFVKRFFTNSCKLLFLCEFRFVPVVAGKSHNPGWKMIQFVGK